MIPLIVANFSHQPVTVHKNTIAAKFEPVDVKAVVDKPIRRVQCVNVSPGLYLPEHLTELYNKSSRALSESYSRKLKEFLLKCQDVFSTTSSDIGYTNIMLLAVIFIKRVKTVKRFYEKLDDLTFPIIN